MKKRTIASLLILILVAATLISYNNAKAAIRLNKSKATINIGETLQLKITGTNKKTTWSSSKKTVATVTSKGKVTAKKTGTTTITAKTSDKKYTCKVTVMENLIDKTAEEIVKEFIKEGLDIGTVIVYDETTDPNKKLGRPNQYISKASFSDSRLTQEVYEGADPVGGTVEVFNNSNDAKTRYDYIYSVTHGTIYEQYMYLHKNVLLRLDFNLTPTQASEYEKVLNTRACCNITCVYELLLFAVWRLLNGLRHFCVYFHLLNSVIVLNFIS